MKTVLILTIAVLVSLSDIYSQTPLVDVHPAYDLKTIRPTNFTKTQNGRNYDEFKYGISAMDFLSDGRLVVATYYCAKRDGGDQGLHADPLSIFIMDGIHGDDRAAITTLEIDVGYRDMHGLRVVNDTIFVLHKQMLSRCTEGTGGTSWDCLKIWDVPDFLTVDQSHDFDWAEKIEGMGQYHQFNYGLPYVDGHFLAGLTNCIWSCEQTGERGSILKIKKDGSGHEYFAGGIRSPGGFGLGPEGGVFMTDNQGGWMPTSKLVHVKEGRFYGFRGNNYFAQQNIDESPPAVWIAHGQISRSPTHPGFIKEGPYAGQMLIGDNHYGGIQRYFLERVGGEYQGAVFRFSGGLESAAHVILPGPNGSMYIGELGGPASNWNWFENLWGLQRLDLNGTVPFEMKAVRLKDNGFEIEFTKPVDAATAGSAVNYSAESWHNEPGGGYGSGFRIGVHDVPISQATVTGDNTRVLLVMNPNDFEPQDSWGLKSSVVRIDLSNAIKSESGESIWDSEVGEVFYTVNNMGEADKLGCTDSSHPNYDASADYDDGLQCPALSTHPGVPGKGGNLSWDGLTVKVKETGGHTLKIFNLKGATMSEINGSGPATYNLNKNLNVGVYFVHIKASSNLVFHKMIYIH